VKILTLGKGFVSDHLPYPVISDRVIPDDVAIRFMLKAYKPDVLINCIGKTGRPNVDWCEDNKAETYMANVTLPAILASECEKLGIHLIHIGSGCIFFGDSPRVSCPLNNDRDYFPIPDSGWKEDDFANPKSYYSQTKYAADLTIGSMSNVTVLRIRMPISTKNDPRNFINKVRNYSQVIDIPNSMTLMDDLVRCVDWAAKENKIGIYHVTNAQPITAAQVMREFQKYQPLHKFEVIDEGELDKLTLAKRSNCLLNTDKLRESGFTMSPSEDGLKACMAAYIKNI
jgi:dTDP-4-dehydrorhamnose reductase